MSTCCNFSLNLEKASEGVILQGEIRVDIAQTRIHCTMILAKFQDKTGLTFINWVALAQFLSDIIFTLFVRVGTADAARDRAQSTAASTQTVNHFPIPSQIRRIFGHYMGKRRLQRVISRAFLKEIRG